MISYAVITPARNEESNLPRLGDSFVAQTVSPIAWLIVENGSTDDTLATARDQARRRSWIRSLSLSTSSNGERGGPSVRAFHFGLEALRDVPDIIVNVDADVSFEPDHFERLLAEFVRRPKLGIASGSGHELSNGVWRQKFTTRTSVWGAVRAWRWDCLQNVLPLEERVGWDGIDECKANARGWETSTVLDLPFFHHRPEGERAESSWAMWLVQGELAHFLDYRPSYLLARTLYRATSHPAAVAMLYGYAQAGLRREAKCDDRPAREYLRSQQNLRRLPIRIAEALGRTDGARRR